MSATDEIDGFIAQNTQESLSQEQRTRDALNIALTRMNNMLTELVRLRESETSAREALQACDTFLDYTHAGTDSQTLAYRYVKNLIKEWMKR